MPDERGRLTPAGQGRIPVGFDGRHATPAGDCPSSGRPSSWQIGPQPLAPVRIGADGGPEAVRNDLLTVLVRCSLCQEHDLVELAPWQP